MTYAQSSVSVPNGASAPHYERTFAHHHEHVPAPFNRDYNPNARQIADAVALEMQDEGFYDGHTRQECAAEFKRRTQRYTAYARGRHDYR